MDEFNVRLAANDSKKKFTVFKLHKDDEVSWKEAKMRRENDYQPWQIKIGSGKTGRRFKAIKEGGINDNASYYIFYKSKDRSDTYEVCPVDEWYAVSATQRYKTLTAEEAEQKFEQRHKMLNLFSVMHLKKSGENGDEGSSFRDSKAFKVSELDDWNDNSGDDDASDDEQDADNPSKKAKRKKAIKKEKDDPDDAPEEAKEDSDEGDYEQREVDYMSDSSSDSDDSEKDKDITDVKGIAEEEALRDLLSTDDEEDTAVQTDKKTKVSDVKSSLGVTDTKRDSDDNGSDDSSDSDDYDVDEVKLDSMFAKKGLPAGLSMRQDIKPDISSAVGVSTNGTAGPSNREQARQAPASNKRKPVPESLSQSPQPSKRPCPPDNILSLNSQEKEIEDWIRKYLKRKPITLKNLLKEIKTKLKRKYGVGNQSLDQGNVQTIADIIKRIDPEKRKINDELYLSLRS